MSGTAGAGRRDPPSMVSIVIPVHNAGPLIEEQLGSLVDQWPEGHWELVLVDNLSTDDSIERARAFVNRVPRLRVVQATDRPSAGHARNVGAAAAEGDFLVFCDADDVAAPGWLMELAEAATMADLVAGRVEYELLNNPVQAGWWKSTDGPLWGLGFMTYASTANFGIWTSTYRHLGGFHEDFEGAAGEDVDFSIRAQVAGYELTYAPKAVMHYRFRSGLRALAKQSYRRGRSGALLYRRFCDIGAKRRSVRGALWNWAWLIPHLPDLLRSPRHRGLWIRRAANSCGRLRGSLRYRVLFL